MSQPHIPDEILCLAMNADMWIVGSVADPECSEFRDFDVIEILLTGHMLL